jgi:hypothetical protein
MANEANVYGYTLARLNKDLEFAALLRRAASLPVDSWKSVLRRRSGEPAMTLQGMLVRDQVLGDLDREYPRDNREALDLQFWLRAEEMRHLYAVSPQDVFEDLTELFPHRLELNRTTGTYQPRWTIEGTTDEIFQAAEQFRQLALDEDAWDRLRECPHCAAFFFDPTKNRHAEYCKAVECVRARDRIRKSTYRRRKAADR